MKIGHMTNDADVISDAELIVLLVAMAGYVISGVAMLFVFAAEGLCQCGPLRLMGLDGVQWMDYVVFPFSLVVAVIFLRPR